MTEPRSRPRRIARIAVPFLILLIAGAGAAYMRATRPTVQPKPPEEQVWSVATVPVAHADVAPVISVYGEVVAGREVALRPLVAGRIVAVAENFVDGGIVREGDLIAEIDPFDYRAAVDETLAQQAAARGRLDQIEAQLDAAHAQLEEDRKLVALSERDLRRREKLVGSSAVSEKALDDARRALIQARQQMIAREETVNRLTAQAAEEKATLDRWAVLLRRARRNLERTRLLAPFAGFLVETAAAIGKQVGTNDTLAKLIDADRLEARFFLSDAEFARLLAAGPLEGRPARVIWSLGARRFVYDAEVKRIASRIESQSGGVALYARIRHPGLDGVLRPGAFVRVELSDKTYRGVVRLPEDALHQGDQGDIVYVAVGGRLEARKVTVAARDGGDVLVKGPLADGEAVVVTRFPEIGPGIKVAAK